MGYKPSKKIPPIIVQTTPSPIPVKPDFNTDLLAPKTGYRAEVTITNYSQGDPPVLADNKRLLIGFYDWQNHTSTVSKAVYDLLSGIDPVYNWNQSGNMFAAIADNHLHLLKITPDPNNSYYKIKIDDEIIWNVEGTIEQLIFSGNDKFIYLVKQDNSSSQVVTYSLSGIKQQSTTIPKSATIFALPNQSGFAYIDLIDNYQQIFLSTPNSNQQLNIKISEDTLRGLMFSPNISLLCLEGYSSGAGRYYLIKNNKVIKRGPDQSYCKAWINSDTVMLHDGSGIESVYNTSTQQYLYQGKD